MAELRIEDLLREFESPELDFKEQVPGARALARTAAAFANGRGGYLIIGVRDRDRSVVGVDPAGVFDIENRVTSIVCDRVEPQVSPRYATLLHGGKTLFIVHIFPGSLPPYHLKAAGVSEGTYVRIGSQTRKADAAAIRELELRRMNVSFDETPVYDARLGDISMENVRRFVERRHEVRGATRVKPSSAFLTQFGALKVEPGRSCPTVGGLLLFSDNPQSRFPQARIKCARFRGTTVAEYLDQKEYDGPLVRQIEGAMGFFKANVLRGARIRGTYREERDAYPEVAVREAVVNAVCHRDYNAGGSDIKFAIFDDRIEVTSPGGLPPRMTVALLGKGVSEVRNRVIARVLREMGLIEEWGQGIGRMRDAMREWGLPEPVFRENGPFFKVVLQGTARAEPAPAGDLDADEQKLLATARAQRRVTTQAGMEITGRRRQVVSRKLARLERMGLLEWRGSSRNDPTGYYAPKEGERG